MKHFHKIYRQTAALLILAFLAAIAGCSEEDAVTSFKPEKPLTPPDIESQSVKRKIDRETVSGPQSSKEAVYPQAVSCTVTYCDKKNIYAGSAFQLPSGSSFEFTNGAMIPPPDHPCGEPVTVTMMAEKDPATNELIFSFGPSGCTFDPPAEVWFNWSDLASPNAILYYLNEDDTRVEHLPDQIDVCNKHMCIYIDHFSRYVLAYSN